MIGALPDEQQSVTTVRMQRALQGIDLTAKVCSQSVVLRQDRVWQRVRLPGFIVFALGMLLMALNFFIKLNYSHAQPASGVMTTKSTELETHS